MIDLDELERLDKAATPEPWRFQHMVNGQDTRGLYDLNNYFFAKCDSLDNGAFIAAMRNALPHLIKELKELRFRIEGLEK